MLHEGETKRAVEFFDSKVKDAMLLGDIKRAVASDTDVILFNIDNKADNRAGRDAILAVFLKVLNELQGYSGDHPHIAHMERYLDSRTKLGDALRCRFISNADRYAIGPTSAMPMSSIAMRLSKHSSRHPWSE